MAEPVSSSQDGPIYQHSEDSPGRLAVDSLLSIDDSHEYNEVPKPETPRNKEPDTPKDWHQKGPLQRRLVEVKPNLQNLLLHPPLLPLIAQPMTPVSPAGRQNQNQTTPKPQKPVSPSRTTNPPQPHQLVHPRVPSLPLASPSFTLDHMHQPPASSSTRTKQTKKLSDPRYLKLRRFAPLQKHPQQQTNNNNGLATVVFDGGQLVPPPFPVEKQKPLPSLPPHLAELAKSLFEKSERSIHSKDAQGVAGGSKELSVYSKHNIKQLEASDPWPEIRKISRDKVIVPETSGTSLKHKDQGTRTFFGIGSGAGTSNQQTTQHTQKVQTTGYHEKALKRMHHFPDLVHNLNESFDPRKRIGTLSDELSFSSNPTIAKLKTEPSMDASEARLLTNSETKRLKFLGVRGALDVPNKSVLGSNLMRIGLASPSFSKPRSRIYNFHQDPRVADPSGSIEKFKSQIFSFQYHSRSLSTTPTGAGSKQQGLGKSQLRLNGITLYR